MTYTICKRKTILMVLMGVVNYCSFPNLYRGLEKN